MSRQFALVVCVASLSLFAAALFPVDRAFGTACWDYSWEPTQRPLLPWIENEFSSACDEDEPASQLIQDEHRNWHCTNPSGTPDPVTWGARFIGFHRQFILDFDIWRLGPGGVGEQLRIWDAKDDAPIPGNGEVEGTAFSHCFDDAVDAEGDVVEDRGADDGTTRPGLPTVCAGCIDMPDGLTEAGGLADFASIGDVGYELESSGWHASFHNGASGAGGACDDIASFLGPAHDPAFWMGHKKLDEVARAWQGLKAADIVIVLDRSGSMNDDCDDPADCVGGPPPSGEAGCKLNAAKLAATLFASLVQDDRPDETDEHMIGLVSFATTATTDVTLDPAAGIVTNNGIDDTPLEIALAGMDACGATHIAAGVEAAVELLAKGSNPHKAILLLTDGLENVSPMLEDLDLPLKTDPDDPNTIVQICAVGIGDGAREDNLRELAEVQGGVFIASEDLLDFADDGVVSLDKFFVNCFGAIFDEDVGGDPIDLLPQGQVASTPIPTQICGLDTRLTVVLGRQWGNNYQACDLDLVITSPSGNLVDLSDLLVEVDHGRNWDFVRLPLPYRGQQVGTWTARVVRPQRVYTHGFVTDGFANMSRGAALVREEIHRLYPEGCDSVLYYEDGSRTGNSAYRLALQAEQAAGTINSLTTALTAGGFNTLLLRSWDLVVFARQVNPIAQTYDSRLQNKLCGGQKALITDFFNINNNPILVCAGVVGGQPLNWNQIVGDNRLVQGAIQLVNPGYNVYTYTVNALTGGGPWLLQARNEANTGSIVGTGTACPSQTYFVSTLTRGPGEVLPAAIRPKVLVGNQILASFRLPWPDRPTDEWDAVTATVTLDRPGQGALETYTLYDNGTNGDVNAGDNYWEREIPQGPTSVGAHLLHGSFDLTEGGCTVHREVEYTVIAEQDPSNCTGLHTSPRRLARPGEHVVLVACVSNRCHATSTFDVRVSDTRHWLCNQDSTAVDSVQFVTPNVPGGLGICFSEVRPLLACVPPAAADGESTIVTYRARSLAHPTQPQVVATLVVKVRTVGTTGASPPAASSPVFSLSQNQPNPFDPATTISFEIAGTAGQGIRTSLRIYNATGRLVCTLVDAALVPGRHSVVWDGRDDSGRGVASGIYFYRLEAGGATTTRRLVLLRH